ncbi:MAG: hypothetical protein Q7T71_01165 [Herbiconiux sp.]|nr:hypothetical protein [Herbiconiux sp.]
MFLAFLIGLGALLAAGGTVLGLRRRRSNDYSEHLDSRDVPGRGHTDGQAAAATGLAVRGSSHVGPF